MQQAAERRWEEARSLSWIWRCGKVSLRDILMRLPLCNSVTFQDSSPTFDCKLCRRRAPVNMILARASGPNLILTNHPPSQQKYCYQRTCHPNSQSSVRSQSQEDAVQFSFIHLPPTPPLPQLICRLIPVWSPYGKWSGVRVVRIVLAHKCFLLCWMFLVGFLFLNNLCDPHRKWPWNRHTWYLSFFLHIPNLWHNFSPHKSA